MKNLLKKKILMTGNEAIAEGAIQAGCQFYAGYPITPQNELIGYMARRMPEENRVFIQAESELAAINMVFGASAAGFRAMTSSSSPGISLKQEGISYLAGAQLPAVIVNIMRAGPGLGNIWPAQTDYFQATRGGGNGEYRCIVLAPASVQECFEIMFTAFDLADRYRTPVIILADGMLGQMMEPLSLEKIKKRRPLLKKDKPWALTGCKNQNPRVVKSFYLHETELEEFNLKLQKKYHQIKENQQRWEDFFLQDAEIVFVAFGSVARIAKSAVKVLREKGVKAGFVRPISLWPFPEKIFQDLTKSKKELVFLVIEMSYGQMLEDVRLVVKEKKIFFLGRAGGGVPTEEEIIRKAFVLKKG